MVGPDKIIDIQNNNKFSHSPYGAMVNYYPIHCQHINLATHTLSCLTAKKYAPLLLRNSTTIIYKFTNIFTKSKLLFSLKIFFQNKISNSNIVESTCASKEV